MQDACEPRYSFDTGINVHRTFLLNWYDALHDGFGDRSSNSIFVFVPSNGLRVGWGTLTCISFGEKVADRIESQRIIMGRVTWQERFIVDNLTHMFKCTNLNGQRILRGLSFG